MSYNMLKLLSLTGSLKGCHQSFRPSLFSLSKLVLHKTFDIMQLILNYKDFAQKDEVTNLPQVKEILCFSRNCNCNQLIKMVNFAICLCRKHKTDAFIILQTPERKQVQSLFEYAMKQAQWLDNLPKVIQVLYSITESKLEPRSTTHSKFWENAYFPFLPELSVHTAASLQSLT